MNSTSLLFSIIVLVYNDEENLPRCLNSICSQTYYDFECLLIDDGSTDSSYSICDMFAEKDSRIHLIHKQNEGISKTRQLGIINSRGTYSIFVDSDDWITPNYLASIYKKIVNNKPDVLFLDFIEENSYKREQYISQKPINLTTNTMIQHVLEGRIFSCLWNVVIRRDFHIDNEVIFSKNINYGEDSLFVIELLLNNPKIDYYPGGFYHHTFNKNSFTRKNYNQRYKERVKFLNELPLLLERYNRHDLLKDNFFPCNDKYEMLSCGVFTRKEYQTLFPLSIKPYYLGKAGIRKYLLLKLAETRFYCISMHLAILIRRIKNILVCI